MPSSQSVQDSEEDQYLYTTVTIAPPAKPKKIKDTIFGLIAIIMLFCILGEQLLVYSYTTDRLNLTKSIYILSLQQKSIYLFKLKKTTEKKIVDIHHKSIPEIRRTDTIIECLPLTNENSITSTDRFHTFWTKQIDT